MSAILRCALVEAQNYQKKLAKKKSETDRDLKLEALLAVLTRKVPARIHAHRADDIMTGTFLVIAPDIGQKMATGENPKRVYGGQKKAPMTRMGIAAILRCALVEAQNYQKKLAKKKSETDRDLKLEALLAVLTRKVPARIHAHRADDIMTGTFLVIAPDIGQKMATGENPKRVYGGQKKAP